VKTQTSVQKKVGGVPPEVSVCQEGRRGSPMTRVDQEQGKGNVERYDYSVKRRKFVNVFGEVSQNSAGVRLKRRMRIKTCAGGRRPNLGKKEGKGE